MDVLAQLESVHLLLQLMQKHSFGSGRIGEPDELGDDEVSDRFMADFFLFLVQRSSNAEELKEKCNTLMSRLPKVSIAFLQDLVVEKCTLDSSRRGTSVPAAPDIGGQSSMEAEMMTMRTVPVDISNSTLFNKRKVPTTFLTAEKESDGNKLRTSGSLPQRMSEEGPLDAQQVPLVGLKAMERASTTLEDFCRSYFMFHDMDVQNPQHIFKHLPILSFVEAFVYQLDENNEEQVQWQNAGSGASLSRSAEHKSQGEEHCVRSTCTGGYCSPLGSSCWPGLNNHRFGGLEHTLASYGLLTERMVSEFSLGVEYWKLERSLCEAVMNGVNISGEDVLKAIRLKSFDYRILNLLLYSLTGREVNESHFEFLSVSELLVEISDDLFDYEDDVYRNCFNVLRMLVKVYGPIEAPEVLAHVITEAEAKYQRLLESLEPDLVNRYQERCKEATREGGGGLKHQFGSWTIPPIIVDEKEFSSRVHASSTS